MLAGKCAPFKNPGGLAGWVLHSLLQMEKLRQELVLGEPAPRPACLHQAAAPPASQRPNDGSRGGRGS